MARFGGNRLDKLSCHLALAVVGSVLLSIGTVINAMPVAAATVTVLLVFAVLFVSSIGSNVASGATAALLAYVLAATSPGTALMLSARLAGWWLATVVSTALVLLLSSEPAGDRLREALATTAVAVANGLDAACVGRDTEHSRTAAIQAKHS